MNKTNQPSINPWRTYKQINNYAQKFNYQFP